MLFRSPDIAPIADKAYRCLVCGHEGGPGLSDVVEKRQLERYQSMDLDALHKQVLRTLQDAQITLHTRTSTTTEHLDVAPLFGSSPMSYALRGQEHPSDIALNQRKALHARAINEMRTAQILLTAFIEKGAWQLERVHKRMDDMQSNTQSIQACLDYCIPRVEKWEYVQLTGLIPPSDTPRN